MKLLLIIGLSLGVACGGRGADEKPALKDQKEKASYLIGVNVGNYLKQFGEEVNLDTINTAIKDMLAGRKSPFTDQESREIFTAFQTEVSAKQKEKHKKEGEKFLADNKTKEGVTTTPSGLQYKIITTGTGQRPTSNDTFVAHYRGSLIDGTEFDNSYKRGDPFTNKVTMLIKGWTEALLLMPVGSKWQLFIPGELAYGERGRQGIPPNATLLFDMELLSIQDKPATNAAPSAVTNAAPKAAVPPAKTAPPK